MFRVEQIVPYVREMYAILTNGGNNNDGVK